jgi:hypothetical protein
VSNNSAQLCFVRSFVCLFFGMPLLLCVSRACTRTSVVLFRCRCWIVLLLPTSQLCVGAADPNDGCVGVGC